MGVLSERVEPTLDVLREPLTVKPGGMQPPAPVPVARKRPRRPLSEDGSLRSALLRSIGAPLACSSGTILVHSVTNMHYTGAADIAVSFVTLIKSKAYVAHYFGTLNAIVFVTRPGQTGCF